MAFAATGDNIRAITGTVKTDPELNVFITAANAKILQVQACDSTLTDGDLSSIADWYASYLLASGGSDANLNKSKEKIEQYEVTFGGTNNKHASERYWETANDLSGGCLVTLDKQAVQIAVL